MLVWNSSRRQLASDTNSGEGTIESVVKVLSLGLQAFALFVSDTRGKEFEYLLFFSSIICKSAKTYEFFNMISKNAPSCIQSLGKETKFSFLVIF